MKITFFDTESTDLTASWGRILCASFAEGDGECYTFRCDEPPFKGRTKIDDSKLVVATREVLEASDIVVGWNSALHDLPLLNARLAKAGERPVRVGEKHGTWGLDLMWYSGGASMKIGSKKLDNVAKYFDCDNQKTPLDGEIWQLGAAGDKVAIDQIVVHCEADVEVLREVARHLLPYVKKYQFNLGEVYPFLHKIPSRIKR